MSKLEQLGEKIAKMQLKNSWFFMLLLLICIVVTLPGIFLLLGHVEPSLEKILPQQVVEVKTMNDMRGQFGADMMYIVLTTEGPSFDIRDPDVLKYINLLENKLRKNEFILEVMGVSDFVKEVNNGVIPASNREIRELLKLHPRTSLFINYDKTLTYIQLRSDTGADSKTIKNVVEQIEADIESLEEYNPGLRIQITGFNAIDKATFEVIMHDFAYITGFSFFFMALFLFIYFMNWRKVVSSLVIIMVGVMITLGLTGYLNITITVVTMVAAAMIMALGVSYGINVTYDYYIKRKYLNKREALIELNKQLIRALVGSSFTTSAGFLALLFGVIPAMKNLGVVLAMGITVTLISSIIFLPVIVYKLDNTEDNVLVDKTRILKHKKRSN